MTALPLGTVKTNRLFFLGALWLGLMAMAATAEAQPSMSRGQQQVPVGNAECLRRAGAALAAEGFSRGGAGNFAQGFRGDSGAYIICNDAGAQQVVNIVVASLSQDAGVPGAIRQALQARMAGVNPGVVQPPPPPPPPPPSNCSAFGTWSQATSDVGTSEWEIGPNGQATEMPSRIVAPVTISGRTIRISWNAPSGYAGIYEWTLDDSCTTGAGTLTFTRGGSGTHKSTIRRKSGAQQRTGVFNATPGACPVTGRWTHNTESIGTTSWDVSPSGQATEYGGSARGSVALTARTLQITWTAPSGYAGYYQWTLDSSCNAGSGIMMFTKGGSGTFKSTVKRN